MSCPRRPNVSSYQKIMNAGVITRARATGILLFATSWVFPMMFTQDEQIRQLTTIGLWVLALSQPLCGLVFVLDGVLIGAGDARYLGLVGVLKPSGSTHRCSG